jgi:selenocysteine-specific elongation factor
VFIIGTAGHVDHGKTLLIKALTGIETDRLPEEKKRGLTIDLGFAHFTGSSGEVIGVVDVPGHERFIRNMTAGAWGIDLALLVIAADDGWMPQTDNHLKVLTAMGIRDIIITVTKTDLADDTRIKDVIELAEVMISEKPEITTSSIAVSAKTGEGVEELKNLIQKHLSLHKPSVEKTLAQPLLYVDRVFSIKGAGLVVTGSLREGSINRGDSLQLMPSGKEVRVRGLQIHDKEAETAVPSARVAVNLTGVSIEEVNRGCCITGAGAGFSGEHEAVLILGSGKKEIRNHSEAEIASGTAHSIGTVHFIGDSLCARIVLEKKTALRTGQPVVIIQKGGSRITGSGIVIWKGKTEKDERIKIAGAAQKINLPFKPEHRLLFKLAVSGWAETGSADEAASAASKNATAVDRWLFNPDVLLTLTGKITNLASAAGGVKTSELVSELRLPLEAVNSLCGKLEDSGNIDFKNETWFKSGIQTDTLSPEAQKVYDEAEKAGKLGLDLGKVRIAGVHKQLRILTRAELIVPITENLFYTDRVFTQLCTLILDGLKSGDSFDIAHTKARTGLSRKYIIPLLNKMEELKMVERQDNLRRVI